MTDTSPQRSASTAPGDADAATRRLVAEFAAAMLDGDRDALGALLADDVVAMIPGHHLRSGLHRGPTAVSAALIVEPSPGVRVVGVDVTEVLVEGSRGVVVLCVQAATDSDEDAVVAFEIALHLQCRGELLVGVTEYAADQRAIDELLGR